MTTDTLTAPPSTPTPHLPVTAAGDARPTHFRVIGTEHDDTTSVAVTPTVQSACDLFALSRPFDEIRSVTALIRPM